MGLEHGGKRGHGEKSFRSAASTESTEVKKAIVILGTAASGKGTTEKYLRRTEGYVDYQLHDAVVRALAIWDWPNTRLWGQRMRRVLTPALGSDFSAKYAVKKAEKDGATRIIFDGGTPEDIAYIKQRYSDDPHTKLLLLYIDASEETTLKRALERGSKHDSTDIAELKRTLKANRERIAPTQRIAGVETLENNYETFEEFKPHLEAFLRKKGFIEPEATPS